MRPKLKHYKFKVHPNFYSTDNTISVDNLASYLNYMDNQPKLHKEAIRIRNRHNILTHT